MGHSAASSFVQALPDDVPELIDQLIAHAMSPRSALAARRAIASGRTDIVRPLVRQVVNRRLATADPDDYRRLAELLVHLHDGEALEALVRKARSHDDPSLQEVAEDFSHQ